MVYADFESILIPENNGNGSYTNEYQNHVGCGYGCKLVCADIQFSKPFKSYLGQDTVHKFIANMAKESIYCSHMMKKHFNKELVTTKKFERTTKCSIFENNFVKGDLKVRNHSPVTEKYRGAAHINYNINVSINYKIAIVFQNLKYFDAHLIMQEYSKFNFKINVILNGLEKYITFSLDYELFFI